MEMNDPQQMRADIEEKYNLKVVEQYVDMADDKKDIICKILREQNPKHYYFRGIGQKPHESQEERRHALQISNLISKALNRQKIRDANREYMRKYRARAKELKIHNNEISAN